MAKLFIFPLHVTDYLSDPNVVVMSPSQRGGYIHLLLYAWQDDTGSLPDDDKALRKLSEVSLKDLKVIKKCFHLKDGRLYNKRLSEARQHVNEVRQKKAESGRLGGIKRWEAERRKIAKNKTMH